jgi:hypothetical protein
MPVSIAEALRTVRNRIWAAERAVGRPRGSVRLIAVAKTQPAEAIVEAYRNGQLEFAENYLQEALAKQRRLGHLDLIWHFIGPIQSNKTKLIASHFGWVHGVDRARIAERLSEQRPANFPPLNVCLQVNISGESTKSGVTVAELPGLVAALRKLPGLRLRGLMAIPEACHDPERQRAAFRRIRAALELFPGAGLDTLSMGMSGDLEAAIAEGSTMVRVGTAIFGERRP